MCGKERGRVKDFCWVIMGIQQSQEGSPVGGQVFGKGNLVFGILVFCLIFLSSYWEKWVLLIVSTLDGQLLFFLHSTLGSEWWTVSTGTTGPNTAPYICPKRVRQAALRIMVAIPHKQPSAWNGRVGAAMEGESSTRQVGWVVLCMEFVTAEGRL